jgi:quercetin dioxygenase-like cupin family protein
VVKIEPLPPVAVSPVAQATFARHQLRLEIPTSNRWGAQERESGMPHVVLSGVATAIDIQTGAVVSRVIFRDDRTEVTVFGFDAGEGLSEHQASRSAIVQIIKGRLEFFADGEQLDAGPGFWLHMEPGTPHSLTAREPTVMLLTLIDAW